MDAQLCIGIPDYKVKCRFLTSRKVSFPTPRVIQGSPVFYQAWQSDVLIAQYKIYQSHSVDANHFKTHVKPRKP